MLAAKRASEPARRHVGATFHHLLFRVLTSSNVCIYRIFNLKRKVTYINENEGSCPVKLHGNINTKSCTNDLNMVEALLPRCLSNTCTRMHAHTLSQKRNLPGDTWLVLPKTNGSGRWIPPPPPSFAHFAQTSSSIQQKQTPGRRVSSHHLMDLVAELQHVDVCHVCHLICWFLVPLED